MTRSSTRQFTFAELLVAMVFIAIVLPVAVRGVLIANRAGVTAERKRTAARLADRMLTELVVTGDWEHTDEGGDFGEDHPEYRWSIATGPWSEETPELQLVTVYVTFPVQGIEHSVELSTIAVSEGDE